MVGVAVHDGPGAPPPPGPARPPTPVPVTTGESRRVVYFENFPASTAAWSRGLLATAVDGQQARETAAGTTTTSFLRLARRGLANAVRPLVERKITVFLGRLALKLRPLMVSEPPTLTRMGVTRVIDGVGSLARFFAAVAGDAASRARRSASRQMENRRGMPYPLSVVLVTV